ncbi:mitochondrial glycerol-3-phosphate dehydrogenase [Coemansia sp. RSA 1813]|nr:mitochondrial glycerol-3-phosphate dehydrogenase [Coemansia sp. RSA 1646]KAJ1770335.1 mitochondrial glycerol-3-phosphate dehydrogenase [Coemansia sp. RSA 1843]KAJ2091649.1 mitochondrial glycerol-3-phosphate dehydrogenase [Coemansia sp. RSA 986]KAJ2216948.1 mitochondrial glycerol-3-phosphate dehydrogenase [Coemansia sp. RSA 487]KAJ2571953.1 mitochondrial glycerol-3-phosphate dehydrogenase [Coemansia sp. RSA 1813]
MWRQHIAKKALRYGVAGTAAAGLSCAGYSYYQKRMGKSLSIASLYPQSSMHYADPLETPTPPGMRPHAFWTPPKRQEMINDLKGLARDGADSKTAQEREFDLLVIGGGATGAGCTLDAATRGLKVAMVERDDFASGTSSKSTKLVHGGVRYLQKAIMGLDYEQWKMVREALHERKTFLNIAPYLSNELPILLPVYTWWQLPYFWIGCKMYDLLAGKQGISSSYIMGRSKTLESFPMLRAENLVGSLVYFDGQHNDARMNSALAVTAAAHGAVVANHVEVTSLIKEKDEETGKESVRGAMMRDNETGEEWAVKAKGVINATGPFSDAILKMDEPGMSDIVAPSSGVHLVLPSYFSPKNMGMLDPATTDGRVVFFLPWEGGVVAGTTDTLCQVEANPKPSEKEIEWILSEIRRFLSPDVKIRRGDVLAAWSGIRPLVRDPKAKNTKDLVRNHMIHTSDSGLITIAGGKWTTYREMAKETIDKAIDAFSLQPLRDCQTESVRLIGSHAWSDTMFIKLVQNFGVDLEVARHLSHNYGDRAWAVCALGDHKGAQFPSLGERIHPLYPFIDAEVRYAVQYEYALSIVDVIGRRLRLAFLDAQAARESIPKIVGIMAAELGWDESRKRAERRKALEYLTTMGLPDSIIQEEEDSKAKKGAPANQHRNGYVNLRTTGSLDFLDPASYYRRGVFSAEEIGAILSAFSEFDVHGDGHIEVKDIRPFFESIKVPVPAGGLDPYLKEANINHADPAGTVEFEQMFNVLAEIKESFQAKGRLPKENLKLNQIPTHRSGGSV